MKHARHLPQESSDQRTPSSLLRHLRLGHGPARQCPQIPEILKDGAQGESFEHVSHSALFRRLCSARLDRPLPWPAIPPSRQGAVMLFRLRALATDYTRRLGLFFRPAG